MDGRDVSPIPSSSASNAFTTNGTPRTQVEWIVSKALVHIIIAVMLLFGIKAAVARNSLVRVGISVSSNGGVPELIVSGVFVPAMIFRVVVVFRPVGR